MKFTRIASKVKEIISYPALAPLLCLSWMIVMDGGKEWNAQMGQWPAGLTSWSGSGAIDFVVTAIVASMLAALLGKISEMKRATVLALLLVGGQICATLAASSVIFGHFPHGIDHPAFMFRVREFGEIFPFALGSYNPWWNAGTEHFIGVTSGAQNFGLINLPLLKFFAIESFYGAAIFFWLVIAFPWIGVFSLRAAGATLTGAISGGLMLCAATRASFLFFWQSGNIGGMVSAMLSLPVAALGWRIVVLRRGGIAAGLTLGVLAWLVSIWSPGAFVCIGVALGWLLNCRRSRRRQIVALFSGGTLALLLYLPWLWVVLFPCRGIVEHVGSGSACATHLQMARIALFQFSRRLQEWHPAILFWGFAAIFFYFRRLERRYLAGLILPLVLVTLSIGWKRDSQLDRMAISLASVCVLPASLLAGRLFSGRLLSARTGPLRKPLTFAAQGVLLAVLFTGLRLVTAHCGNSAGFKMWPSQPSITEFIEVVRREVPQDARLAFAGDTDCRYEWGKPAFFPILAQREMMADDYYGYPRKLISRKYPPLPYRKSIEGVEEFSRIYGITHWATAEKYWRGVFMRTPERFRHLHNMHMQSSTIDIFEVLSVKAPGRFLTGSGRVEARESHLDVFPSDPSAEDIVIRYNWRDGLYCRTPGAEIMPYKVDENIVFIAIKPNGNAHISIGYRPLWRPLAPNADGTYHH